MREEQKFYVCKHCGNVIGLINNAGVPLICCGEEMTELIANNTEAKTDYHIPATAVNGNLITVDIGKFPHPMTPEHHINWVYIQTERGGQRKNIRPGEAPAVVFSLAGDDKYLKTYAHCTLHGLWVSE